MSRRYPLRALVVASGLTEAALGRRVGLSGSTLKHVRVNGLAERSADRYAVRAGLHPFEVWPEMVEHHQADATVECAAGDCSVRFIPTRKSHRYHSTTCFQREYKRERYRTRYATDPEFRAAELERSRRQRETNAQARKVKHAAWYQRNRTRILAAKRARITTEEIAA